MENRSTCSVCQRSVFINLSGCLRDHGPRSGRCPGSNTSVCGPTREAKSVASHSFPGVNENSPSSPTLSMVHSPHDLAPSPVLPFLSRVLRPGRRQWPSKRALFRATRNWFHVYHGIWLYTMSAPGCISLFWLVPLLVQSNRSLRQSL